MGKKRQVGGFSFGYPLPEFVDFIMNINDLTGVIIHKSLKIHSAIGPGCFEKVYEELLGYELAGSGLQVKRQILLPIDYEGLHIEHAYKLDMLVEDACAIELKAIYPLPAFSFQQIRTQLSLLGLKHGILLNFKVAHMKDGIHRIFNNRGRLSLHG